MEEYIDLHMHTAASVDGSFSAEELISQCRDAGLRIIAIADHNSVRSLAHAETAAKENHLRLIPAIEIDCTFGTVNLHVLGYGIDWRQSVFGEIEDNVSRQELAASQQKLVLTNALGFALSKEQLERLSPSGIYTGEMFAEALLQDPRYQDHELLKPYRAGGSRSDNPYVNFYWDWYSQGRPCYTEVHYPSLRSTVQAIRHAGGVPVLAHPGNNLKDRYELFDVIIDAGVGGVEAFSSYHTPEAAQYFLEAGQRRHLLITCGSDYHGKTKPAIHLGRMHCTIDEHEIEAQLQEYGLL